MTLHAGTRVGPYEILAPLGSGGMGEVYRASDTRLRREVAVKILPAQFTHDADRLRRFEQEALATAALNHPNILSVYDVGAFEGVPYVVSELLEGRTLRDELDEAAPLPVRRTLDYAQQIARGLAAAHGRGIVHRDLKPENLFVTKNGHIKILDFGLAKLVPSAVNPESPNALPTKTADTEPGIVLGTMGYMPPEQVRGLRSDHRSDIFSLGAVMFEMLAARRAFVGSTSADTITAILKEEPFLPTVGDRAIPTGLARVVTRCLEKDPESRFQSASDLAFSLEALAGAHDRSELPVDRVAAARGVPRRPRKVIGATAVVLGAAVLGALAVVMRPGREGSGAGGVMRFTISADGQMFGRGGGTGVATSIDISPDGKLLAFVGGTPAGTAVWLRPLDSVDARQLPGTDGASGRPFWSPDSRALGFFASGKLKRIDLTNLTVQTITDAPQQGGIPNADGTWNVDGAIVFSQRSESLFRVSATGGERAPLTALNEGRQETSHLFPQFLPDGKHFVYVIQSARPEYAGIYLGSLDQTESTRLLDTVSPVAFAPPGYLMFLRNGALMAQAFDADQLRLVGDAEPLGAILRVPPGNALGNAIVVSSTGILVFGEPPVGDQQFVWVERQGREVKEVGEPGQLGNFDLSIDDTHVVFGASQGTGSSSIWEIDLRREVTTRVTNTSANDSSPVWSPDSQTIAFSRAMPGGPQIVTVPAVGGQESVLAPAVNGASAQVDDWSPDGRFVTFNSDPALKAVPVAGGAPFAFVETSRASVDESHFSPDGKWIAYNSNDSGTWQVYVAPFPATGQRWQVSAGGGVEGRWRADGKELYYLTLDGQMMAVDVNASSRFEAGAPRELFDARITINPRADHYAVARDGQRFLLKRQVERSSRDPWTVVINWPKLLPR